MPLIWTLAAVVVPVLGVLLLGLLLGHLALLDQVREERRHRGIRVKRTNAPSQRGRTISRNT